MYRLPIRDCLRNAGFFSTRASSTAAWETFSRPLRGGSHSCLSAKISRGKVQNSQGGVDQTPNEGGDDHIFHGVLRRVTLQQRPLHPVLRHKPVEDAGADRCQQQRKVKDARQGQ